MTLAEMSHLKKDAALRKSATYNMYKENSSLITVNPPKSCNLLSLIFINSSQQVDFFY